MSLFDIFNIFMCGIWDRLRGMDIKLPSTISALFYGAHIGFILAGFQYEAVIIAILWMLGSRPGLGEPMGAAAYDREMNWYDLEGWQVGPLERNTYLALSARGVIWGAPCALASYWIDGAWIPVLSMAIAMPTASFLCRKLFVFVNQREKVYVSKNFHKTKLRWPKLDRYINRWGNIERFRGWLNASLIYGLGVLV